MRLQSLDPQTPQKMQSMRSKVVHITPPPSTLGGRAANAAHRLSAFLHSLKLVSGDTQTLRDVLLHLVSITTDLGVESLLTRLEPFALSEILPLFDHAFDRDPNVDLQDLAVCSAAFSCM